MAVTHRAGKFAILLHADVAGSTFLVRQDEHLAHERIQTTFRRFGDTIARYHGRVRELRGDALLAEFERASDAATAALAFQADQSDYLAQLDDTIQPKVRVGIAMGEVIIADDTITGEGMVLAQRVEQLADPGGVCITGAIQEALPTRLPFDQSDLGEQQVKGFDNPARVYSIGLKAGAELPEPTVVTESRKSTVARFALVATVLVLICGGGLLAWMQPWQRDFEPASVEKMALPLPDKPSIAVLFFDNYSDDEKLDFFADGLTENITSALSKAPGLFVIARNSAATYKGKPVNLKQVAEDLGVQYVLEGSVQKSGDQLRITVQLVDAIKGHHLWTDRFDRQAGDVFAVQDEITKRVFTELQVELTEGEHARMAAGGTENLDAWLLRIEAYSEYIKFTRESQIRARELYTAAHEADPSWAFPVAGIAFTHWYEARRGWSDSRNESIRLGIEAAEQAIELQPNEPIGYMALGNLIFLTGKLDQAIEYRRKAVELAPNAFTTIGGLAIRLSEANQEQEAIELFERAIRLSPKHPWWVEFGYGIALHLVGRKEEAVETYKRGLNTGTGGKNAPLHARLAAVYADLGRMDEAKAEIDEVLRLNPKFAASTYQKSYPFPTMERNNWYKDLLVQSGLPEHPPLKLPHKPSIAVLPFDNLSPKGSESYLADAITESLIATLGQVPELFVIARNSTFAYKDQAIDVRQVGRELGVRHVLEGSVQQSGDNIRITAQLIDATTGEHLWAERYDRPLDDFFALQDEIALKILVSLQGELTDGGDAALRSSSTNNVQAYLRFVEAKNVFFKRTKDAHIEARRLVDEALELDPAFAMPKIWRAWIHVMDVWLGFSKSPENSLAAAEAEIDRIGIFEDESVSTIVEGEAYLVRATIALLRRQYDLTLELGRKSIELIPDYADALAHYGALLLNAGQPKDAVRMLRRGMRLSPQYESWQPRILSVASTLTGDHDGAVAAGKDAIDRAESDSNRALGHMMLAIAYAEAGMVELARDQVDLALKLRPDMTVDRYRAYWVALRNQSDVERILGALRAAGLPD